MNRDQDFGDALGYREAMSVLVGRLRSRCTRAVLSIALVVGLGCCGPNPATPRGVAERFLDAYFNLDRATALATSAHRAHELVEEEGQLTAGHAVDAATRMPTIRYWLAREERGDEATVHLVYTVRIIVPDAETSEQRWLLTVGRLGEEWKVVSFERLAG